MMKATLHTGSRDTHILITPEAKIGVQTIEMLLVGREESPQFGNCLEGTSRAGMGVQMIEVLLVGREDSQQFGSCLEDASRARVGVQDHESSCPSLINVENRAQPHTGASCFL